MTVLKHFVIHMNSHHDYPDGREDIRDIYYDTNEMP